MLRADAVEKPLERGREHGFLLTDGRREGAGDDGAAGA
jgi:hypothetical protein